MWTYNTESKDTLLAHFDRVGHQKAHVLYSHGDIADAISLYAETIQRFEPKLIQAHLKRSSDVVLRFASRMALYAYRSHNTTLLTNLWLDYPCSYEWSKLSQRGMTDATIIGLLAKQEHTPEFQQLRDQLAPEHLLTDTIEALQNGNSSEAVLKRFATIFEDPEQPVTPWSDEPMLAIYERLKEVQEGDWQLHILTQN